jgi:hypothetical protein
MLSAHDETPVWVTAWSDETISGAWAYCLGFSHLGRSCVPDRHGIPGEFHVQSYSVDAPAVVTFIAEQHVTHLEVAGDRGAVTRVELVDIGLPSGYRIGAHHFVDGAPNVMTFEGRLANGAPRSVSVRLPLPTAETGRPVVNESSLPFRPAELP